jgi:AraC family transcriptional regulator
MYQLSDPKIEILKEKILAGKSKRMSLTNNTTGELWSSFMKEKSLLPGLSEKKKFSLQIYPPDYFEAFDPSAEFVKWAAIEVSSKEDVPPVLELMKLPGGKYSVFHYKGSNVHAPKVFQYILQQWLPSSGYKLDDRPHFEILGDKYKNGQDDSEEEIWIPVK